MSKMWQAYSDLIFLFEFFIIVSNVTKKRNIRIKMELIN